MSRNKSALLLWKIDMRKNDKSRKEHIAEMQRVIHEIETTTSEYGKEIAQIEETTQSI